MGPRCPTVTSWNALSPWITSPSTRLASGLRDPPVVARVAGPEAVGGRWGHPYAVEAWEREAIPPTPDGQQRVALGHGNGLGQYL